MSVTRVSLLFLAACNGGDFNIRTLNPSAVVAPQELVFGEVGPPLSSTIELLLSNTGGGDLNVSSFTLEGPSVFTFVGESSFVVAPREELAIPVTFTPDAFRAFDGKIVIESDDLETPRIVVPLTGEGVDLPFPDIEISPARTVSVEEVTIGDSELLSFDVKNVGDAPLTLTSVTLAGDATFAAQSLPTGAVIAPGQQRTAIVKYTPADELGDNATVLIASNDPDETSTSVLLLGNGGGPDFEFPVAVIDCPATVLLTGPEFLELDGSDSFDPAKLEPLTYQWTVTQRPAASDPDIPLDPDDTEAVDLYVDVAGEWTVQLVVANAVGTESEPAVCAFTAVPEDDIHVELSWDQPRSDVDLHLVQGGADVFDKPEDCHFGNPSPNWGTAGPDDDPRLDIDDIAGLGPENINVLTPADGTYEVYVHYFAPKGDGASIATVKVWLFGVEVYSGSRVMEDQNDLWSVGTITVPAGTFSVDPSPNGSVIPPS
jgi:Abnormal spindle-like microcephaly-assoc'd, ASPM-SPD-2-Hydin